jgi:low affinity Fe/Cu permease
MKELFHRIAAKVSTATGSPPAFLLALLIVAAWGLSGPLFHYSDTWQLVINTGTTIVTFLMVFLIQNTQNRDAKAMHLKLDELIRSSTDARNKFVDLEDLTDEDLEALDDEFKKYHDSHETSPLFQKLHRRINELHARRHTRSADKN